MCFGVTFFVVPRANNAPIFQFARSGVAGAVRTAGSTFLTAFLTFAAMKATVTSKGQITIPLPIRRKLKLHKGTVLEFDEQADHLRAIKSTDARLMRSVVGIAKRKLAGKSVLGWLDELRGPVALPPRKRRR